MAATAVNLRSDLIPPAIGCSIQYNEQKKSYQLFYHSHLACRFKGSIASRVICIREFAERLADM